MSKKSKGLSEQQIKDKQTKEANKAAREAAREAEALRRKEAKQQALEKNKAKAEAEAKKQDEVKAEAKNKTQNGNSQEKIEMARTGEDPWKQQPTNNTSQTSTKKNGNTGQGRNRQERTYPPALPPVKETIDVTPTQSKKTGAITDQEVKDYIANANPENINDVMKMTATFLASQDPERVIATAKAAMEESNAKKPKQTGSLISRITSFCCLYLGHLAALIFLAFISGSTDMIRLMLTAPFLILLFIGELILCKRLTTNNE